MKSANNDLPLTSSSEAKRTFQVDTSSQQAIQAWLVSRLSALLRIDASLIDIREPFASYGMGSTEAVSLSGELADWLGRPLSAELAYEFPTIESLAQHLAGNLGASETSASPTNSGDTDTDRIAIVGIGCRMPGANSPQAFWKLLSEGVDAITEVPAQRFKVDAYYDADPASPGKINTRWGGFIDNVDRFDSHFFGISPREAARMDPQQRLLLEVTWEALEDAGAVPEQLTGTRTGVFIGISNNDYGRNQLSDLRNIDAYAGTGNALSIAANRISYVFDFRGPSIAVDTACSSSLVAVHLACSSLRNGESTLAIAGGVNLILSPAVTINFTKAGVMAPDGRCKAFDSRANGYVRGEGVGVVVLKRLAQAIADGDPIYAVIHGSAVNQDGRSNGLMAPNPLAQESVLRDAYEHAGISPGRVQYIEAHGTGTLLGDPIEAKALGKVLAVDRPSYAPCAIGSVKTNIGHLEAAAGIAGLIKTALALKWGQLPPSLHFEEPNPLIPFDDLGLQVPITLRPWPAPLGEGLAGVSSFGFGGTNAHVVLAEAPSPGLGDPSHSNGASADESHAHPTQILTLSARNSDALKALARSYREFLSAGADTALSDICYTANARRGHQDYRLALLGDSQDQMIGGLDAFLRGESSPGSFVGKRISSRKRKLVFVFPGQGSQWFGMGRELLQHYPAFRDMIIECDHALRPYCEWSLISELKVTDPAKSRLGEIDVLQPMLFAVQMGLAALWQSWGVEPDAAVGHSMGEIAAACAAGALTLQDAARVICERSRLLKSTIGQGAMASVELSPADAQHALVGYEDRLAIALNNAPTSTVLSGDPAALMEVIGKLQARDVYCRIIKVDFAAHSPQMVPLQAELSDVLSNISPRTTSIPIYSTVTGKLIDGSEFSGSYWASNLREPVLFAIAVERMFADGCDTYIELSPNPSLLGAIQQAANHLTLKCARLPSMRREKSETAVMLDSLGELYALGSEVNWSGIYPKKEKCVTLPSYPWQSERHWLDVAESSEGKQASVGAPSENIDDCLYELLWQPDQEQKIASTTASSAGAWLIFADESGIGEALATRLEGEGQRCVRVEASDSYEHTSRYRFRIDPRQPEHFQRLCAAAFTPDEPQCRGIVHLWSLDTAPPDKTTASSLEIAQTLGCYSVLHLVQQVASAQWTDPPRLWIATQGAQRVSAESAPPSISQAPVWGLGRVIAQEHPTLWGGLVDLDPDGPLIGESVDQLWQQTSQISSENQVAFRQGHRYVARLARRERSDEPETALKLRADSTYLIVGGLGDLGLAVAQRMIDRGACRLILLGRTQLPPRSKWREVEFDSRLAHQVNAIRAMEAIGASLHLASIDVTDELQLSAFLAEFAMEGWPPIRGVVHTAGVLNDGLLSELDSDSFNLVLRPKVLGSWLLHQLLANHPLDFFVLFSSASALLGQPGQGNYAAANAFLDSLAHYRRAQGRPALTINWGAWSDLGFANTPGGERLAGHLSRMGIESLPARKALAVLQYLLEQNATQAVAVNVNWHKFSQFFQAGAASPLLSGIAGDTADPEAHADSTGLRRATLLATRPELRHQLLQSYLVEQVARVLGLSAVKPEVHQPLSNLGLDSLMAIELKNRIVLDLGINLPIAHFLQGPSIDQATTFILEQLSAEAVEPFAALNPSDAQSEPPREHDETNGRESDEHLLATLDQLSDDEVNSMLTDLLAEGVE